MFKFVLCALFAAAVAEPQFFYTPYSESYIAPATTTVTKHASSVVTSPYYSTYGYEVPHFIKKREAQFLPSAVLPTSYVSNWATPYNYLNSNAYLPYASVLNAHLIKKRSAGLISHGSYITPYSSYIAPGALTYSSGLYHGNPLYSSYIAPAHLIKKRSAQWSTPYLAAPIASTYVASSPLATSYSAAVLPGASYWSGYGAFPYIKK
ncbi:hypothetical protein RR46_07911 [Papilio xuthus]|uniref:Cuticular protein n=1 Tax=Papilio xuthus TaxID=66420 RepID=A0A194QF93_PAPXU|nr:hypothetical protein RR46_07911 [Papilio xuthus]